jgi:hypothetical protein
MIKTVRDPWCVFADLKRQAPFNGERILSLPRDAFHRSLCPRGD